MRSSLRRLVLIGLVSAPANGADDARLYTSAQAQRGAALYDLNCASCHGFSLQGGSAIALSGPTFQARWVDGRHSIDDLFYIVRTLMPNDEPGKLPRQQYLDIVAYMLSVNGWAPGEDELPLDGALLKTYVLGSSRGQQKTKEDQR